MVWQQEDKKALTQQEPQHRHALPHGFWLNEYQIERVLGKPGGFGITYLATDSHLQQHVAIKEYLPGDFAVREGISTVHMRSTSDEASFRWGLECFMEEARVLARFHHPNIVRVLRFFESNGTAYMVMEYQEGESLTEYVKRKGPTLCEADVLSVLLPLLDGLKQIHEYGLLHRDIKPNNIYIRQDETPVLLDFGSARYAISQKSRSVTSIVSPGYAPLEQYDNESEEQGPWTDIYAIGAVSYFMISGEPPAAATRRVMKDPLIPALKLGQGSYNKNLLTAIDWALELSEKDRPQSVDAWRAKFSPLHAESMAEQRPRLSAPLPVSPSQRWLLPIAGLLGIALLASSISALLHLNEKLQMSEQLKVQQERQIKELQQQLADSESRFNALNEDKTVINSMLDQVLRFADQTTAIEQGRFEKNHDESAFNKYYDIINVAKNDVLNIRPFPGDLGTLLGIIPPEAHCIPFLDRLHFVRKRGKAQLWVMVKYQGVAGWVHSAYLSENPNCQPPEQEDQDL